MICYHRIFAITFDENFAQATGVSVSFYNTLIAILTAITVVLGMRMMGALLISSLIIFPALSSMRLFKRFSLVILCAAILSVVCFCVGMVGSYQFDTPVGASVVVANLAAFLLFCLIQKIREQVKNVPFKPNRNSKISSHFNNKQMTFSCRSSAFLFSFVGRNMKSL